MSNVSIFEKKWIDLVFEDRNQMYGAYQLRQQNPRITIVALFCGILVLTGFISLALFSNYNSDNTVIEPIKTDIVVVLSNYNPTKEEPKQEKAEKTTTQNVVTEVIPPITIFTKLTVAEKKQVVIEVPTNEELKKNITPPITGTTASAGFGTERGTENGQLKGNLTGSGTGDEKDGIEVVTKSADLDKQPVFPGGINKFYEYVATNFRKPHLENGTIISVIVAFVVEKDGSLSNIRVIRNTGKDTDKEAVRVLTSLKTKWSPGVKDGKNVRTEFTLPIKVEFE